ncbi:MAG: hypothetical protein JSR91_06440 [Proteobacteria bacterium]|nr:hypothetical protein [Pseudomonadota bacterium]
MGIEIPKPKDWQSFQRNCVLLFRDELDDRNTQEFGRSGQDQGGIDIIACRNGDRNHYVGVQCRLIAKPLKKSKILSDARQVLALGLDLKELIFATTAPDDAKATKAAIEVERDLAAEGHDLRVVVLGWEQMQKLICLHDVAYHAFHPFAVSTSTPVPPRVDEKAVFASAVATEVIEQLRATNLVGPPLETTSEETAEDPLLHAKIDTFRDLFKEQALPLPAQKGLQALLAQELTAKPWARYRIETILGSIELDLGKEKEAAQRFRFAFALRPTNPKAIANLALAQTIDGEYAVAMQTAQKALDALPSEEHAVSVLLQAAARSDWSGNPEELVPPGLRNTLSAEFGLAEFVRRRESPGWQKQCIDVAARHPERNEFKLLRATAVLALVVENPGKRAVASELVALAAEDLRKLADRCLNVGFADPHDLMAHVNNAALLLRFSDRHKESEDLLVRGIAACGDDAQLRRLLALARFNQGRIEEAIKTLANDTDVENVILRAEFLSTTRDHKAALVLAQSISDDALPARLRRLRWNVLGELGLALSDWPLLDGIIQQIRAFDPHALAADLLAVRKLRRQTRDHKAVQEAVQQLIGRVGDEIDPVMRFDIASEAYNSDLPEAAADLLEGQVDLHQAWPPTFLYLESLATARRDASFRSELARTSDEVRHDPRLQWVVAAHAWNRGDLDGCLAAIERLLSRDPNHAGGRLLKIEVLMRQDRSSAVLAELDADLERLPWKGSRDEFRLASLLNHFGYVDRAAALAYRLFLKHRDLSRAWMTLSAIVLDVGPARDDARWRSDAVGPDAAVDLRYDDGSKQFFVIENDVRLRNLDESSWEPSHTLATAIRGLAVGARFAGPDGRGGVVANIRHKYVARLHYVLENYEKRFPTIFGVKQVPVDIGKEGGLDHVIAELQTRRDYVAEEEERYYKGPWPLEAFAKRVGIDPIEAAAGLAAHGRKLKVAVGTADERQAVLGAIARNQKQGCVLDLVTFWTAHRLQALAVLADTCGAVHVTQSVVDRLRERRHRLGEATAEGVSSATLIDGKFAIVRTSAEQVTALRDDMDSALQWITSNATIQPLEVSDNLPGLFRDVIRKDRDAIFYSLALAVQQKLLFVSDDLAIRQVAHAMGAHNCTWLHAVLGVARDAGLVDFDRFVRWSAELAIAGQNFLSVTGDVIAHAASLDFEQGVSLGPRTIALSGLLGGKDAERQSHTDAAARCLLLLWNDSRALPFRRVVTSQVLRAVTRERVNDSRGILDDLERRSVLFPDLLEYIESWRIGHFLTSMSQK